MILDRIAFRVMGTEDYCKLFLWVPKVILQAIYYWPGQQNTTYKRQVLFIISVVLFNFMNIGLIYKFISISDSLMKIVLHIPSLMGSVQATAKLIIVYYYYYINNELEPIVDDIMYKFWPYDLIETKLKQELKIFYYVTLTIVMSEFTMGMTYSILLIIQPWSTHTFPYDIIYPFNTNSSPYYEIIYITVLIIISLETCYVLACDYSFMAISASTITQFKLLQQVLLAFNTPQMVEINEKLRKIGRLDLKAKKYSIHKEYFVRCVNHHLLLLEIIKKLNRMYSSTQVILLTLSMAGICSGLSTITAEENNSFSTLMQMWTFIFTYLIQLFLFCIIGNELYYQASFLPDYIFRCNWHTFADNELSKDYAFMLLRAQNIPRLTAYSLYDLNLDTYIRVVKFSFSMYTFLDQMKQK